MADVFKAMRDFQEITKGISPADLDAMMRVAEHFPDCKFTVPTPGTEAKLNGVSAADIAKLVADVPAGQPIPTKRELIERLGGNPKSSRDQSKVAKVLPTVPEIEIRPGQKAQMLRRLTGPAE
jgi:hypothetical protein